MQVEGCRMEWKYKGDLGSAVHIFRLVITDLSTYNGLAVIEALFNNIYLLDFTYDAARVYFYSFTRPR